MRPFYLLALIALFLTSGIFAQEPNTQMGITEHLGENIPLELKFLNENSDSVTLKQLVNKPTIFSFVYFDCPGLCSPLLEGVSEVIEKSDLSLGKDYQVITISFNFRDNPEKAKKKKETFSQKYQKTRSKDWIFLTTDSSTIYKIIGSVGYNIKPVGMDFVHPSAIVAVSPTGKITRYLYGLSYSPFDFKMAVIEAGKELPRPTIQKVLEFCYTYDPDGRRYALEITKLSGVIILFLIIVILTILFIKTKKSKKQ